MGEPNQPDAPVPETTRFFKRSDWVAFAVAFALSLAVYTYSLAPTVTLEDSGEMAVASDYLGVPHPPGYPLWTMLSWAFTEMFQSVHYMGQPNPAWAVGFMSAVFGALTAALIAMLVSRMSRQYLPRAEHAATGPPRADSLLSLFAGIAAGLAAAFAPVQWSQSVIVEVYTMNAFLVVVQLMLAIMWVEKPRDTILFMLALVFGISFTHYFYASAVNITILVTAIWIKNRDLFWDSLAAGLLVIGPIYVVMSKAFPVTLMKLVGFLTNMTQWGFGGGEDVAEILSGRYVDARRGIVTLVIGLVGMIVVRAKFPKDRKLEKFISQSVILALFLAFSFHFFLDAYRAGGVNDAQTRVLIQQARFFVNGVLLLLIPTILWMLQAHFLPKVDRRIVVFIIPSLYLLFLLLAGAQIIRGVALTPTNPQDMRPAYVILGIQGKSKYLVLGLIMMAIAPVIWTWRRKVFHEWRRVSVMALLVTVVWILVHLYLPWSSDKNPPMNWGYPRTLEGFKHAVFRGQYQAVQPFDPASADGVIKSGHYFRLLFRQFTLPIALLGLLPFCCWHIRLGRHRFKAGLVCVFLGALVLPFFIPAALMHNFDGATIPTWVRITYGSLTGMIAALGAVGLAVLIAEHCPPDIGRFVNWLITRKITVDHLLYLLPAVLVAACLLIPLKGVTEASIRKFFVAKNLALLPLQGVFWTEARVYLAMLLRVAILLTICTLLFSCIVIGIHRVIKWLWAIKLPRLQALYAAATLPLAIALLVLLFILKPLALDTVFAFFKSPDSQGGIFAAMLGYISLILYMACAGLIVVRNWMVGHDPDTDSRLAFEWTVKAEFREWMAITFFSFVAWGLLFACFANIKLEIQDTFIQRVKFLTSYGIFSIWIGHGLIQLTHRYLPDLFKKSGSLIRIASVCCIACLPVIPILNNAYNERIINEVGAADLNGHDFGWQFGNYQLRGANAMFEELSPDEEPLPNALFPPEMGPDAIFYGGTDPGRFVPTYMIFSALVRPDVYLITQNALADNTYMSVMRDLYGNDIWIPAQPDSAKAFDRYVREVKAGRRPPNAHIKIENGRVQVSGALGVMEINGILAQMIFERNNYRHDFYVEESYVIRWMYPYLTPHGLVMKINPTQTALNGEMIRDDLDLWDWYTRRLLSNRRFLRDVSARKSFSKLRSALAGLYSNRGNLLQAEQAFHEARILYPLSPEGNFRLSQEVYFRQNRFDDARRIIQELSDADPGSGKPTEMIRTIDNLKRIFSRIGVLEKKVPSGKLSLQEAFELANLYREARMIPKLQGIANSILGNTNLPVRYHFEVAKLFRKSGRKADTVKALDVCLSRFPANTPPQAFLETAQLYIWAEQHAKAVPPMQRYLKGKPSDWKAWLDLAALQVTALKNTQDAGSSLQQAVSFGGSEALNIIRSDPRFRNVKSKQAPQARPTTRPPQSMPIQRHPWGPRREAP